MEEHVTNKINELVKFVQLFKYDQHKPLYYYMVVVNELERRGKHLLKMEEFEKAFIAFSRMLLVILSYIPKHPDFKVVDVTTKNTLDDIKKCYVMITAKLKTLLKVTYENEYKQRMMIERKQKSSQEDKIDDLLLFDSQNVDIYKSFGDNLLSFESNTENSIETSENTSTEDVSMLFHNLNLKSYNSFDTSFKNISSSTNSITSQNVNRSFEKLNQSFTRDNQIKDDGLFGSFKDVNFNTDTGMNSTIINKFTQTENSYSNSSITERSNSLLPNQSNYYLQPNNLNLKNDFSSSSSIGFQFNLNSVENDNQVLCSRVSSSKENPVTINSFNGILKVGNLDKVNCDSDIKINSNANMNSDSNKYLCFSENKNELSYPSDIKFDTSKHKFEEKRLKEIQTNNTQKNCPLTHESSHHTLVSNQEQPHYTENSQSMTIDKPIIKPETQIASNPDAYSCLRTVVIPVNTVTEFVYYASSDLSRNIETLGILAGKLMNGKYTITHIILPEQSGTSDTCEMTNEDKLFEFQIENDLLTLGWIHTHPKQACFLSSVDIHTHYGYQCQLKESVAIVAAYEKNDYNAFRLTRSGMDEVGQCNKRGFHTHSWNMFEICKNVEYDNVRMVKVIDKRKKN